MGDQEGLWIGSQNRLPSIKFTVGFDPKSLPDPVWDPLEAPVCGALCM